jgi:hypothetical protein
MEEASIPAPWTEIDQAELDALRNALIKLSDTGYGRFKEQTKRGVEQAYAKMSAKEKEILKRMIGEINVAVIGDKENSPPCLTPM